MVTRHIDRRTADLPAITREDVRDAALTLFAEKGYHGTSLKEVAQRLGLRTPSLYNHMESKSALLSEIVLGTLEHVVNDYNRAMANADGHVAKLRTATEVYALHHATYRREALVVNQDTVHLEEPDRSVAQDIRRRHEKAFRQIIVDGRREGVFTVDSPKLASFAIREMCVSIARWFREDGEMSPEQVARQYGLYAVNLVGAIGIQPSERQLPSLP
ncbi:TetR/AcrR family transcriptional regulator [Nocardia sp. alder85J]|uniref:TetR/AcrR family transcriptional regulator n=1 Tax=Nocardia sp. alder85J TaxID=2862949 RepID=UPI001CD63D55|nr:TetR/AcrR family transcriptional regulator [Nocardia sp. alder85J]MCX4095657.1 TetR/AcrR family transcriptional regulator [Nocardia sp. alder85J]